MMWLDALFGYLSAVDAVASTAGVWVPLLGGSVCLVWGVSPPGVLHIGRRPDASGRGADTGADVDVEESA
ncbi:hypothetical protein ACH4RG_23465 [Streptomyces sp. NPDC021019]|uniref:hypothetical protein n=1 Tax=Streptomyces sp. NPDC021019 TaxID=3365108 RepID=UPI00378B44AC